MFAIFTLSGSIGYLMLGNFYKSGAGSYKVVEINGGKWLKYIAGDNRDATQNVVITDPGSSWDLKRVTGFVKSRFPHNNIFIPLDNAIELPVASNSCNVILCGKNYLQAKRFQNCAQYWLLPEGAPPEKYPVELKKIYISRYDETGYNHLWKNQDAQTTILIEETD